MNRDIWDDQFFFNKDFFKDLGLDLENLTVEEKVQWSKEFFFHISKELADLVECLPHWKMHYKNIEKTEDDIIYSNIIEEYVDVLKYLMGLGQVLGINYEQLSEGYYAKTEVVQQKYAQNQKIKLLIGNPVIVFDIDGVVNTYPECFLQWVKEKTGHNFISLEGMKTSLDLRSYQELKTKYRLSGMKREQPVVPETLELMNFFKSKGETIVLFTNRPVAKYKRIFIDTLQWLKNNNIPFDAIYWSDFQRKEDIYKLRFKIKFIIEDDINNAKNFIQEGHLVYLLNKTYNKDNLYSNPKLIRIDSPKEIKNVDRFSQNFTSCNGATGIYCPLD